MAEKFHMLLVVPKVLDWAGGVTLLGVVFYILVVILYIVVRISRVHQLCVVCTHIYSGYMNDVWCVHIFIVGTSIMCGVYTYIVGI